MARCSLEHGGLQFCRDCAEYPCGLYAGFDESDSFVPHSSRERDLARARELGLEAYTAELDAKLNLDRPAAQAEKKKPEQER